MKKLTKRHCIRALHVSGFSNTDNTCQHNKLANFGLVMGCVCNDRKIDIMSAISPNKAHLISSSTI